MFLAQLRNTRSSIYDRAINVAVYPLAFGRYLALTREELSELGVAGLLMDVGELLAADGFGMEQSSMMRLCE
jgi:HD-GYP domain-containing protein (c-di-GMP phosphodiesterase class II)